MVWFLYSVYDALISWEERFPTTRRATKHVGAQETREGWNGRGMGLRDKVGGTERERGRGRKRKRRRKVENEEDQARSGVHRRSFGDVCSFVQCDGP
jgi:hypothetical protein